MPKTSEAQLLLILLKKIPDASKVERLLKPENLLILWQHQGHSPDEMREKLASGTLPGELLMEMIRQEPDTDRLLALLPIEGPVESETPAPEQAAGAEQFDEEIVKLRVARRSSVQTSAVWTLLRDYGPGVGAFIIVLTGPLPSMMQSGFYTATQPTSDLVLLMAFIGGIVAGIVAAAHPRTYWRSIPVGIVLNLGMSWLTMAYLQASGETIWNYEPVIPILLGAIPGAVLYGILYLFSYVYARVRSR